MSQERRMGSLAKIIVGMALAATAWWLVRRIWLVKEGTEAEPPATPGAPVQHPRQSSQQIGRPDPVDEAIAESFPASDPPSYAGARGREDTSP